MDRKPTAYDEGNVNVKRRRQLNGKADFVGLDFSLPASGPSRTTPHIIPRPLRMLRLLVHRFAQ